jgi:hypothetical protein
MARKTQLWKLLPWVGGMNTSLDPAMIPENQLVNSENITIGVDDFKKKREGIKKNWDDATSGTNAIIGGGDYWYYSGGSMLQKKVSIDNAGAWKSYNASSGAKTNLTVDGVAYGTSSNVPTVTSSKVMNSLFITASDGSSNRIKKWDASANVTDLLAKWGHTVNSCSSSGTTRTVVLGQGFKGISGDYVVITGMSASFNGTWAVASVATTTATNDTITFAGTGSITLANGAATYDHLTGLWTKVGHGMVAGQSLTLTTTTTLPTGYALSTQYFVIASGLTADVFKLSATSGGSAVTAATDDGTGVHTVNLSGSGAVVNGIAPNGAILQTHQGRLLTNDKTKPYRLHYSQTGEPEIWGGYGDSGAIDIDVGDDDPVGITAIFPTFRGDLYVAKRTKLYRIRGLIPDYIIEKVTDGIGAISHEAVAAIDLSDVIWASEKGIHSLATTDKYGDVEEAFLSKDIQKSFNGQGTYAWSVARRAKLRAQYLSNQNLVAFGVTETTLGTTSNNSVWLFHVPSGQWVARWPAVSCESMHVARDSDGARLYLGASTGRIYKTFTGASQDTSEAGVATNITMRLKTGVIFVDKEPISIKGFKKLYLYYTPRAAQTISASVKVDRFTPQSLAFDQGVTAGVLGDAFTLGTSILGSEGLFAPYSRTFDGYGRGVQVEFQESNSSADYTIQGIGIEYQPAEIRHLVDQGTAS